MSTTGWQEYFAKARALRDTPMVKNWIAAYQTDKWSTHADCRHCGFPHSPHLLCSSGNFGTLRLGKDRYSIQLSNVVFFYEFMLELGRGWGFHWRDQTFFKRAEDGSVEVRHIEQFNNHPQIKEWRIPPNEWASIVAAVSKGGETSESYSGTLAFHMGSLPYPSPGRAVPHHGSGPAAITSHESKTA